MQCRHIFELIRLYNISRYIAQQLEVYWFVNNCMRWPSHLLIMSTAIVVAVTSMALSIQCISGQICELCMHVPINCVLILRMYKIFIDCSSSSSNSLRLYNPNGNTATEGGMLQICRSGIWRAVCDYTFDCTTEGRAACRQLGYSGNQISGLNVACKQCSTTYKSP